LVNIVKRVAVEAGELILEYFDGVKESAPTEKSDGSLVTLADQEAEKLIEARLLAILPDIPVIGEESFADGRRVDTSKEDYFWLVDPLDGTQAFVNGDSDFTVNIALIYKREPVLGVIYAPDLGELYMGYVNEDGSRKAMRYFEDSDTEKEMRTRSMPKRGVTVISNQHFSDETKSGTLLDSFKVEKIIRLASSLKICRIANGKADIYPRFGPTCEWDTAAGHAIIRGAGGDITDMKGASLLYGGDDPKLLNPNFIAVSGSVLEHMEFV